MIKPNAMQWKNLMSLPDCLCEMCVWAEKENARPKCDKCKRIVVAYYGRGPQTEHGTILPSKEKLCYECYCEKYSITEEA